MDGAGANLDLPEAASIAFLFAAVFELKRPRVQERFLGGAVLILASPRKPLRVLEQILAALIGLYSSFYSRHERKVIR